MYISFLLVFIEFHS